jgi:hypothetical protein
MFSGLQERDPWRGEVHIDQEPGHQLRPKGALQGPGLSDNSRCCLVPEAGLAAPHDPQTATILLRGTMMAE